MPEKKSSKEEETLNIECWVCKTKFYDPNYPVDDKVRHGLCSQECAKREAPY
jgi:hypothetical protein